MSLEEQTFSDHQCHPTPNRLLTLLQSQQDRVYNLCYQVLRHAQDAEDAAQKVLLKLVDGIGDLPDVTALRRWLYRVCMTTALDMRTERARRRAREREVALMKKTETAPEGEGDGDLVAAIGSLEADQGELILRHFFEKATLKELAEEEQVSEVAIWKRIEKGKDKLRELLTNSGTAMSMASLDIRLSSIVPMRAPAALTAGLLAGKAGAGAIGAAAVVAKVGSTVKIVAASIGLLAVGLAAAVYVRSARAQSEAEQARFLEATARRPLHAAGTAPPPPAASPSSGPASAAGGAAAARDASRPASADDRLRERMRLVVRIALQAKGLGKGNVPTDAEAMKDLEALQTELSPALKSPASDPSAFVRYTRLALEVMFEEFGVPMTESQKASIAAALDRTHGTLEQSRNEPVRDRTIGVLRGYRELLEGMRPLSESQQRKLAEYITPTELFPVNEGEIAVLNAVDDPVAEVLRVWTQRYRFEDSLQTIAGTAARSFVEAWDRVDRQFEAQYGHRPGPRPADAPVVGFLDKAAAVLNYAISTQEAQRDALRLLEAGLTPEQRIRLQEKTMVQFQRGQ